MKEIIGESMLKKVRAMSLLEHNQNGRRHTVTLAGGFTAVLSNSDRNEWDEYVRGLPEFTEYVEACHQLLACSKKIAQAEGGDWSVLQEPPSDTKKED